ncbi:MAG: nucleotidyltransferase family protein [Nanoarchaeota archaeon]
MPYNEIKQRNGNKYFYRVISVRNNEKICKKRVYLGKNLSRQELSKKSIIADKKLIEIKRDKTIKRVKSKIIPVLKKYNIKKAGIFGSYARGEQKKTSDVDILIEPPKGIGIGFVRIADNLEKALGKKVDLVTYKFINNLIRKTVLKEEVRII